MTENNQTDKRLLQGKSNFLGWYRYIVSELVDEGLATNKNNQISITEGKEKEAKSRLKKTLSLQVMGNAPMDQDALKILNWFKTKWGYHNPLDAKKAFREFKMIGINPHYYLDKFDELTVSILVSGGTITEEDKCTTLLDNIHPLFYSDYIRTKRKILIGTAAIDSTTTDELRNDLVEFWTNTPEETRKKFAPVARKSAWEPRLCKDCQEHRPKIANTHNTDKCRYLENKPPVKPYFDTGANQHFFRTKPDHFKPTLHESVIIANGKEIPIVGEGTITLGQLQLNVKHVPEFDCDLVSGTQLMNDGYTLIMKDEKLSIMKNGETICIGTLNSNNLIELQPIALLTTSTTTDPAPDPAPQPVQTEQIPQPNPKPKLTLQEHVRLGHFGTPTEPCIVCTTAKRRKHNIPHLGHKVDQPLELIEMDIQGPFPLPDDEGNKSNVKLVDHNTTYVKCETIPDKSALTMAKIFKRYQARMERRTGKKIKFVRTDSGTEFAGEFLNHLESEGIIKQRGIGYDHHVPGKCERMHQTILGSAKSMLLASRLPLRFYGDALLTATYIWNRIGNPSPYEQMFGKPPNLSHIVPFGSIGYAFIPPETRTKLHPTRQKCRVIGYGDDDDTEEIKGYKLLIEDPEGNFVAYTNDVVFLGEPLTPLPSEPEPSYDMLHDVVAEMDTDQSENYISESEAVPFTTTPFPTNTINTIIPNDPPNEISGTTIDNHSLEHTETITPDMDENASAYDMQIPNVDDSFYSTTSDPGRLEEQINQTPSNTDFLEENLSENPSTTDPTDIDPSNIIGNISERTLRNRSHIAFLSFQDGIPIPKTKKEALNAEDSASWKTAIDTEMQSLRDFKVFLRISDTLPIGEKAIPTKYVFSKKGDMIGNYLKHKARLVARGFLETTHPDTETKSFVLMFKTLRVLLKLAASHGWSIYQDDVKSAFLHAPLQKPKWIRLPDGTYALIGKALYGLSESNRDWFDDISAFMISLNFRQSQMDPCLFIRKDIVVGIYVDDTLVTGTPLAVQEFRDALSSKYSVNQQNQLADLYLGLEIEQTENGIYLSQRQFIKQKLNQFSEHIGEQKNVSNPLVHNFQDLLLQAEDSTIVEPLFPYRQMVGSLMYIMTGTRFDIAAAVSIVSRYLDSPKKIHCDMVRRIFWYLRGSIENRLLYHGKGMKLQGYVDSSYANLENFASLSGYGFVIDDSIISWTSTRQPVIALSSAEAEYIALTPAVQEVIWLKDLLNELGYPQGEVPLYEDNQACILLAKNPQDHKKTRHIQLRFHWIREQLKNKVFCLEYCDTKSQRADLFTKGLFGPSLRSQCERLGMTNRAMYCRRGVELKQ
jgi:hypothetical protein